MAQTVTQPSQDPRAVAILAQNIYREFRAGGFCEFVLKGIHQRVRSCEMLEAEYSVVARRHCISESGDSSRFARCCDPLLDLRDGWRFRGKIGSGPRIHHIVVEWRGNPHHLAEMDHRERQDTHQN